MATHPKPTCPPCSAIADGNAADLRDAGSPHVGTAEPSPDATQRCPFPAAGLPLPGDRILYFGDYELLGEIAHGGMGVVYKARQMRLNRVVALKMILNGALDSDTAVRRFHAEAQAAASLQHPNIVAIHEIGEHQGRHYFSMDYIEGQNLARVIGGKPLPSEKAASLLATIAETVHYAHVRGVLHRDLKPSNVLIDAAGLPHITDFGLAKHLNEESGLTLSGVVMGSPGYMPPEQLRGQNDRIDARSDVYALGATLYEALTGRVPFLAATAVETLRQVEEREPVSPRLLNPVVPVDLETVCLKCLEKDPQKRYAGANALADDLRRYLRHEPIVARPVGAWEKLAKWARRRPAVAALIGVCVLAAAGFVAGGVLYNARLRAEAERARLAESVARKRQAEAETARKAADHNLAYAELAQAGMYVDAGRVTEALSLYLSCRDRLLKLGESDFPVAMGLTDLYALSPPALLTFRGHTNGVFAVAFSHDGERALSAGYDRTAKLWDIRTGREIRTFSGHGNTVYGVALSPDGKRVLTGSRDATAKLWDADTGQEIRTFAGFPDVVRAVAFSSDGPWAVTTSGLSNSVWNADTGRFVRRFGWQETNSVICGTAVSPDGKHLLTAANQDQDSTDNAVILWDLDTGRDLRHFKGHLAFGADFSPDGRHAASGGMDTMIAVWDLTTGKEIRTLVGHKNPVEKVKFSPDGARLLSCGRERDMRLWDVATGQEIRFFAGHGDIVYGAAYSPDGRWALSGSMDKTLKLWAIDPPDEIRAFVGHTAGITSVRFSPDGRLALSASMDCTVRVWDVATGFELRRFDLNDHAFGFNLSADGALALAARYSDFRVFRMETGEELLRVSGRLFQSEISPDGRRVLSGCYLNKGPLALWDATTGKLIRKLTADEFPTIGGIVFLPDGKRAITCNDESEVTLWDLEAGKKIRDYVGLSNRASCAAVSRDGAYVASGGWDRTLQLWDVATGRSVRTFKGHEGNITSIAFSPDGRWLFSGGGDNMIRIWNVRSGEEIRTLSWKRERLDRVAVAPDGLSALVGSSADGTIRRWDFTRPEQYRKYEGLVEEAQRRLTKNSEDAGALKILGEYYAFRGINDRAADMLESARKGGAPVSALMLARCYWSLAQNQTTGGADQLRGRAAAEFQKEMDRVQKIPSVHGREVEQAREQETRYLKLCAQAVLRSTPAEKASAEH